jgi:F-type H+-transporting ATPase subunit b
MTNAVQNSEIIDAMQDAVLNVVNESVSTAQELVTHHHEPFYLSAEFWVAMSFVLTVVVLFRPVGKMVIKGFKKRSMAISKRISDAVSLKEEAQKMLAEYERKFRGAEKEAKNILVRSEKEIEVMKKDALSKLDADMATREADAKMRLKTAEERASKEIASKTAEITMSVVKTILNDSLNDKVLDQLIDLSIDELEKSV